MSLPLPRSLPPITPSSAQGSASASPSPSPSPLALPTLATAPHLAAAAVPLAQPRALEVLFLTSFSDPCFRVTPALAQMADDLEMNLTLAHAYDDKRERLGDVELKLRSFFPEADGFGSKRMVVTGDFLAAAERIVSERTVDMIVAPPSDPLGFWRLLPSRRAALLEKAGTLLWTAGQDVSTRKLRSRPRNIACWLELDGAGAEDAAEQSAALQVAGKYAEALSAQLHVLYVLPDVLEGTLRPPSAPLCADEVWEALRARIPSGIKKPEVHVSSGGFRPVVDLLRRCDADLLVLGADQAMVSGWLGTRMSPLISQAPCPVICVGDRGASVPIAQRQSIPAQLPRRWFTGGR